MMFKKIDYIVIRRVKEQGNTSYTIKHIYYGNLIAGMSNRASITKRNKFKKYIDKLFKNLVEITIGKFESKKQNIRSFL